jgi:DNA-binding transcriptional MerR regulator
MDGLLVHQTIKLLGVHRTTLYEYERRGLIVSRRDANNWRRFDPADVIALKERLNSPPPQSQDNV